MDEKLENTLSKIHESIFLNRYKITTIVGDTAFVSGGHNGPHFDIETPVRNTCHFIVFLIKIGFTDKKYLDAHLIQNLKNWLIQENRFYNNGIFINRNGKGKDCVNGVIGAAWILEALYYLLLIEDDPQVEKLANDILKNHRFDRKEGIWHRYDTITNNYKTDKTLDHQIWFAYAKSLFEVDDEIIYFLDRCENGGIRYHDNGLIKHTWGGKRLWNKIVFFRNEASRYLNNRLYSVEVGYHLYVIQGLALLKKNVGRHSIFEGRQFLSAMKFLGVFPFKTNTDNPFLFKYNNPIFSLPIIIDIFNDIITNKSIIIDDVVDINHQLFLDEKYILRNYSDTMCGIVRFYESII